MFVDDCNRVLSKMTVNPFLCSLFQKMNSSLVFPQIIADDSFKVFQVGKGQYNDFVHSRFVEGSADVISTTISKNALKLPIHLKNVLQNVSPKIALSSILITKLRDACCKREEAAKQLFCSEFTNVPECLATKDGKPYHSTKSDLLQIIAPKTEENKAEYPGGPIDALVIDFSVVIRSEAAVISKLQSFQEYTFSTFIEHLLRQIENQARKLHVRRMDIVLDTYQRCSVKGSTREDRGNEAIFVFKEDDNLPKDFASEFLLNDQNKIKLNQMVCECASNPLFWNWDGEIVITRGTRVWSRSDGVNDLAEMKWDDGIHEEADNRMVCHMKDILYRGFTSIQLRTVDTDVVAILLGFMPQFLEFNEDVVIIVDFGTGNNRRKIRINECYASLGEPICTGLMFFHAFTGCDSTCAFFHRTKTTWFQLWMNSPVWNELTTAFQQLSWLPTRSVIDFNFGVIAEFVKSAYSNERGLTLNELRFMLFSSSPSGNLRELPPSESALQQHILRSTYQAGWVWGNTLSQRPLPPVTDCGWKMNSSNNKLVMKWTDTADQMSTMMSLSNLLKTCKCAKSTTECINCSCGRAGLKCLMFCNCKRRCIK